MKKVLFCLSITLFSLTFCMQERTVLPDGVEVIEKLPSDRWQEFRTLRIKAAVMAPQAIGATVADETVREDDGYRKLLEKSLKGEGAWMVFAQREKDLIAMAGALCTMSHLSTMRHTAKIISVYTDPGFRRHGIASKLIETLLVKLKNSQITQAQVWVTSTEKKAIGLYEKLGFTQCGKFSNDICVDGVLYDSVLMEKTLKAESSI